MSSNKSEVEEHRIWYTTANKKLESIYNQLSEFENLLSEEQDENSPKLFELLETINAIQEHHNSVVVNIISSKESITDKRSDLETQMELLEKSIDLLKLETNWKEAEEQEESMD